MATDVFGLVGTTIDNRYRVDEVVGEGGFGVVYRGFHLAFKHPVAVKCLKLPSHFTPDGHALFLEKFREEGSFLSRLSEHGSIVRVFDLNVTKGPRGADVPYLVLEWLEGAELEGILRERRARAQVYSEQEALTLMRPVVEAIAVAHAQKIAHRDLKPANLFAIETTTGSVLKVLDFGIAKAMQEGDTATQISTRTSSGFSAFSPNYGAPEQFRPKRFGATGPWTDVHALGLILTELVSGRPALEGEEIADYYEVGTAEPRPTPRQRGAEVSDAFEAMCQKALALEPRNRMQSAYELGATMDALLGRPVAPMPSRRLDKPVVSRPPNAGPTMGSAGNTQLAAPLDLASVVVPKGQTVMAPSAPVGHATVAGPAPFARVATARPPSSLKWLAVAGAAMVAAAVGGVLYFRSTASSSRSTGSASGGAPTEKSLESASAKPSAVASAITPDTAPACPDGMEFIKGGTFEMGAADGRDDEKPVHQETVEPFCIDKYEVTVAQYAKCVRDKACPPASPVTSHPTREFDQFCNVNRQDRDQHPINCVDWKMADTFCRNANRRLPTEVEWEYAARGASGRKYPWGDGEPSSERLNACGSECRGLPNQAKALYEADDGWPVSAPVGSRPNGATPENVFDLAGNVWEWTASKYCKYGTPNCTSDKTVNRGGGWGSDEPKFVRSALRSWNQAGFLSAHIGFRCAM